MYCDVSYLSKCVISKGKEISTVSFNGISNTIAIHFYEKSVLKRCHTNCAFCRPPKSVLIIVVKCINFLRIWYNSLNYI